MRLPDFLARASVRRSFLYLIGGTLLGVALYSLYLLQGERELILKERALSVQHNVETAQSVVAHFYALQSAGTLPEAEARKAALAAVKAMRYGKGEYFWVNDMQAHLVMHPIKPELDGRDMSDAKDPNGKALFVEMVRVVQAQGEGVVDYLWPKPGHDTPVAKVSYVKGFAPWGWIVGSGVYLDDVDAAIRTRIFTLLAGTICLGALLSGLCLLIAQNLMRQLGGEPRYAHEVARTIASGDLSEKITVRAGDQTSLLASMAEMRQGLEQIVSHVRLSTQTIVTASDEIATGNADLSARTESQASSLEETNASIEALTHSVRESADNARQATQLAKAAATQAQAGGTVVHNVVATMGAIQESSRKIVDIIAVIDGIAFQTNILALNAAVEAARAGEQGRGFAVVASEVRNLAQRSASAAKEIKDLIHQSVATVNDGSQLVDQAGGAMDQVVASVQKVAGIIGEISSAMNEQSAGIAEISDAVGNMDEMTQQNAALVEEAAAAAESMRDQAHQLSTAISRFRLS